MLNFYYRQWGKERLLRIFQCFQRVAIMVFAICFVTTAHAAVCSDENGEIIAPVGAVTVASAQELYDNGIIKAVNTSSNNDIYDLTAYVQGEEWSVYFPDSNKIISGYGVCGPSGKSKPVAGHGSTAYIGTSMSSQVAYSGCYCKLGDINDSTTNFAAAGNIGTGATPQNKLDNCRANCPSVCANYIATDAAFRAAIYGGADNCPVGTPGEEPNVCEKIATDYCDVNDGCEYVLNSTYSVGYTMDAGGDYCVAIANEYVIMFTTDGNDVLDEMVTITYGSALPDLPIPTMDGKSFQGWFDEDGNEYTKGTIYNIADDLILYAQWGRDCDFPVGNALAQTPAVDTVLSLPTVETLASNYSDVIVKSGTTIAISDAGMNIYNADQRFSVEYENGLLWGTAFCGPNGSGDRTKLYYTNSNGGLTAYQSGKGCWCRYGLDDAYITEFPWERAATMNNADDCRATCPSVCANYTATDSKFRGILLNEDVDGASCPVMDASPQCEERTGYIATYNITTGICEYTARIYTLTLNLGDETTTVNVTYDAVVANITPPVKENYMFAGYYTQPDGAGDAIFDQYGVFVGNLYKTPSNQKLYAYWIQDFCTDKDGMVVWNGVNNVALTADLLARGIIAKKDSVVKNEYIINDFATYTSDQRWAVYFPEYGYVTGSALCGSRNKASYGNAVSDVVTGDAGATVSQTYSGCWCRYGEPVPDASWVSAGDYYNSGDDWATRTDACRLDCPMACANAIAGDAEFRRSLYGGNNCPLGSDEQVYCIAGQYMQDGVCTPCPDGYTSDVGATSQNQCYTTCATDCVQPTCPENATCAYGSETATGTQNWGGTCNAVAPTCSMTITCNAGYWLNGDTCEICPAGSYCANNIKTECDAGYTTDATGATDISQCYTTCERECTPQSCPENSTNCSNGVTKTTGRQYYGDTCNAAASVCELTFDCDTGYDKVDGELSLVEQTPLIPVDYHESGDGYAFVRTNGDSYGYRCENNSCSRDRTVLENSGITENNTWASHFDYGTVYGRASCQPSMTSSDNAGWDYIWNNIDYVLEGKKVLRSSNQN